jgi:hypothetical protein
MTPKQWFAVGALASMPFTLAAQQAPARPDPLDANAAVPTPTYKSAFDNYQPASRDQQPSADKVWRMANDQVAQPNAHAGHAVQTTDGSPPAKAQAVDHSKHH